MKSMMEWGWSCTTTKQHFIIGIPLIVCEFVNIQLAIVIKHLNNKYIFLSVNPFILFGTIGISKQIPYTDFTVF